MSQPDSASPTSPSPASFRFISAVRRALAAVDLATPGRKILVGCSGGPDSTALLLALATLQGELDLALHVAYIDHGLRPGSAADGEHVLALAAGLDLPAEVRRVTVPCQQPPGAAPLPAAAPDALQGRAGLPGGLMAAARAARYLALAEIAAARQAHAVAVGHTRSDQAETVLIRLMGGAGLRGLGGMRQTRPLAPLGGDGAGLPLIRPLLKLSRADVLAFVESSGLSPLSDPTNLDRRFLRGRVRHELLPLLHRDRPDIEAHLAALAEQLQADADYLDGQAQQALSRLQAELGHSPAGAPVLLPARGLRALPQALASRVVLLASGGGLSQRHVAQVLDLCRSTDGSAWVDLPQGRRAERRYEVLRLDPLPGAGVRWEAPQAPGSIAPRASAAVMTAPRVSAAVMTAPRVSAAVMTAPRVSAATPKDAAVHGTDEPTTNFLVPPALQDGDEATASFQAPADDETTTSFQVPAEDVHREPNKEQPAPAPWRDGPTATIRIPDPAAGLLIHGPGRYHLNDTDLVIELVTADQAALPPPALPGAPRPDLPRSSAAFVADAIDFPLRLRVRRPGDRILLRGLGHHKKVSDVLIDHKVPRPARAHVLVLCQGDEVLWIVGLRTAERGRPQDLPPGTAQPLLLCRLASAPADP